MKQYLRKKPSTPILLSIPHSGELYPKEFLKYKNIELNNLKIMTDYQCHQLIKKIDKKKVDIIIAECSRAVIDLNRSRNSIDESMFTSKFLQSPSNEILMLNSGLGVIPRKCYNEEIFHSKLPELYAKKLLKQYYDPYHKLIKNHLFYLKKIFNYAILIDIHSMPSINFKNERVIDIIIGDNFGKSCSCEIKNYLMSFLKKYNLNVKLNAPYSGGYITRHYGKKQIGFHAIQIEINKSLYMNEKNFKINKNLIFLQEIFKNLFDEFKHLNKIAAE